MTELQRFDARRRALVVVEETAEMLHAWGGALTPEDHARLTAQLTDARALYDRLTREES